MTSKRASDPPWRTLHGEVRLIDGLLAIAGVSLVSLGWLHYLWLIPRERVPERPVAHLAAMVLGPLLSAAALAVAGPLFWLWVGLALASVGLGGFFWVLMAFAPLPDGNIAVCVGEPLLDFTALDSTGAEVGPSDWRGRPVLFKFFRGHW